MNTSSISQILNSRPRSWWQYTMVPFPDEWINTVTDKGSTAQRDEQIKSVEGAMHQQWMHSKSENFIRWQPWFKGRCEDGLPHVDGVPRHDALTLEHRVGLVDLLFLHRITISKCLSYRVRVSNILSSHNSWSDKIMGHTVWKIPLRLRQLVMCLLVTLHTITRCWLLPEKKDFKSKSRTDEKFLGSMKSCACIRGCQNRFQIPEF